MKYLHSLALSRPFMLVLMGLSLGFSLNMLLSSLLSNQCNSFSILNGITSGNPKQLEEHYELHYKSKSELENEAVLNNDLKKQRIIRPRFLSSELGLKEKMVIGVLTSTNTLETFGTAINKTMFIPNVKSRIMFFMNGIVKEPSNKMHLVMFSQVENHMTPFFMLKYLADNYLQSHNWFYIFPDTTFVNREKLEELVDQISVGENIIIGSNHGKDSKMCDFDAGILMSQSVLMNLSKNIQWCMGSSSRHENHSQNIEKCLQYSLVPMNLSCSSQINKLLYQSLRLTEIDNNLEVFSHNSIISFSHSASESQIYKIFRKLAEINKLILDSELSKLLNYNKQILPFTPSENVSFTWPLGSEMNSHAKTRFDVIRWHYLNGSHIFHDRFKENLKSLRGIEKLDISDILKETMNSLNKNEYLPFVLERLVNGYRRFDASRGMEYILDVLLSQTKSTGSHLTMRRIHVLKPLGFAEVVPAPYVNESTKVRLIVTITPHEKNDVISFIESFVHTCIESGDNSNLLVVFVYESFDQQSNDLYAAAKSAILSYDYKNRKERKISWISIVSNQSDKLILEVMDEVQKVLPPDSLVLICTISVELRIDFINHVRMNTISESQVYFPIGYASYKPHLVHDKLPYPKSILINQKSGHYSAAHYDHASFYLSDFVYCKNQMLSIGANFINLFEMFIRYHSVSVFQAVDPSLRMQFRPIKCLGNDNSCLHSKYHSLASRSQLAMLIFEYLQKLDELQLQDRNMR